MQFKHQPVMRNEVINYLEPALKSEDAKVYYDLTLGLGGHTEAVLHKFDNVTAVGIDRDQKAIDQANRRLKSYGDRFFTYLGTYDEVEDAVDKTTLKPDAILMDLGVSSMQLDDTSRGFSYSKDTVLDMRMNQTLGKPAGELVDDWDIDELSGIISKYGEEKHARRIAESIKSARPETTGDLADAIRLSLPANLRRTPYAMSAIKRVFQAIRIAVNDELKCLERALPAAISVLQPAGRLAVLSYHSLEDRIVKGLFRQMSKVNDVAHALGLPAAVNSDEDAATLKLVTRGGIKPTVEEMSTNSRAKSAILRVAQKVAAKSGGAL